MDSTSNQRVRDSSLAYQNGHTLVELLVACPIFAVLVLIMTQFFLGASDGLGAIFAQNQLELELSRSVREVLDDVRQTTAFVSSPSQQPAGSPTNCSPAIAFTTSGTTLCLQLPSLDPIMKMPMTTGATDMVVYNWIAPAGTLPGRLERTVVATAGTARFNTPMRVVSQDISNVLFLTTISGTPPNQIASVQIQLTGRVTQRRRPYTQQLTASTRMRNYRR